MKALICRANADDIGTLKFEDVTLPPPGPREARVRVRAASVNFPDILMVQGKYQHRPELPFTVGGEFAGDVIAVGADVTNVTVGDRVVGGGFQGAFAAENQLAASGLRKIPGDASYAKAAAFTTAYLTATVALARRGDLQAGESLLVHGAAGGVGLAAVDLGRVMGARVIATASSEAKRTFLKDYGADLVLPSSGFREAVKAFTGGGADVIYDPVGGDVFDESTRCIAFNGRLLVIGFTSGRIPSIAANIPLIKGFSVVGVRAGEYGRRNPEKGRENIAAIDKLLAEKKIRPHIGARFALADAIAAMRTLSERTIIGKAIVEP
ncbi:MAG TPA: NADPH:quinone oxidoreductase family protein [Rhizomicrobium sp.]|jgi:NADPH2:quinone reductase|nr:NADPH:quinone oxidoreductase family protein [Rhizomicrobium sp.]